jgi:hypothetical protein
MAEPEKDQIPNGHTEGDVAMVQQHLTIIMIFGTQTFLNSSRNLRAGRYWTDGIAFWFCPMINA